MVRGSIKSNEFTRMRRRRRQVESLHAVSVISRYSLTENAARFLHGWTKLVFYLARAMTFFLACDYESLHNILSTALTDNEGKRKAANASTLSIYSSSLCVRFVTPARATKCRGTSRTKIYEWIDVEKKKKMRTASLPARILDSNSRNEININTI